ncbi:MAG: hypothetical protein V3T84_16805 [Phycisphaerales bacterium]
MRFIGVLLQAYRAGGLHDIEHTRTGRAAKRSDRQSRVKLLEEAVQLTKGCQLSLEPGSGRGMQSGRARPGINRLGRGPSGDRHRLWAKHDSVNSKEPIEQGSRPNRCCGCRRRTSFYPPAVAGGTLLSAVLFGGDPIGLFLGVLGRLVTANGQEP